MHSLVAGGILGPVKATNGFPRIPNLSQEEIRRSKVFKGSIKFTNLLNFLIVLTSTKVLKQNYQEIKI